MMGENLTITEKQWNNTPDNGKLEQQ